MAEVGRVAVRDPGALLPGGFWAAVAVWLERPQVANKRLCGVRLESRRSAALPRPEAGDPRPSTGPEQEERPEARDPGPSTGPEQEERDAAGDPRPSTGPEQEERPEAGDPRPCTGSEQEERTAAGCGSEETPGPGHRPPEGGPGARPSAHLQESQGRRQQGEDRRKAAAAPLPAGAPGQPGPAGVGEGDFPAWGLDSVWDDFSRSLVGGHEAMLAFLTGSGPGPRPEAQHEVDVVLRTVIPKRSPHCPLSAPRREIVVQDVPNGTVTFLPLEEDDTGNMKVKMNNVYQIQLRHSEEAAWFISVLIFCPERWHSDGVVHPKLPWLAEELLPRLARWAVQSRQSGFKSTLSLIPIEKYSEAYMALKEKYKDVVKVWPEVTNPEKFVYEDVAIATYLLVLWEEERAERGESAKQSFVDLGCGNGLLVHILSSEGHPGKGIDVQRRKIWDMYGPQTHLEEDAIIPNDRTLFPDVDWLIGNHSDELTPWIPVIAARSSYNCRFFVLPCCFFDFIGRYHRRQSEKTQYRGYLDFIREVGLTCGFHVDEDCLRIPSTKRVCLIGKCRTYPPAEEASMEERRTQYINSRQGCPTGPPGNGPAPPAPGVATGSSDRPAGHPGGHPGGHRALDAGAGCSSEACAEEPWLTAFRPREKAKRVRNCAALPRDFVDRVVLQVANLLLGGKQLHTASPPSRSSQTWNPGGSLSLAEVAGELDRGTLQRLKRECGGLQTLLKNNRQVFEVLSGMVRIRDWREEPPQKQPDARGRLCSETFKTRLCWFFTHHPDGCVLPAACCPFAHGPAELQPPPATKRKKQSP